MPLTRVMLAAQETNDEESEDSQVLASRKRARTTSYPVQRVERRNTRSLKRIFDLPLEIFNEIASHLTPAEVLFLGRSNQFFRRMFMSRSSVKIWRSAFGNVPGLPPCPPELCEPHYASLLYSKTCSECGAKVLRRMDVLLLVKLCNSCRDELVDEFEEDEVMQLILPCSQRIFPSRPGYIFSLKRDMDASMEEVRPLLKETGPGLKRWFVAQTEYIRLRKQFAAEVESYLDKVEEERAHKVLELKNQRRDEIERRLIEEGWSKKDMDFPSQTQSSWLELVFQPKPLTDRTWNNVHPKLVRLLEANKAWHDELDKKMRLNGRRSTVTSMILELEQTLSPMVHVTLHAHTQGHSTMSGAADAGIWAEDNTFAIGNPLPDPQGMWTLPVAQDLIGPDVPWEDMEPKVEARREDIKNDLMGWRNIFLQRAMDVWLKGRSEQDDQPGDQTGPSAPNIQPAIRRAKRRSTRLKVGPLSSEENPHDSMLPMCTVNFATGDHTTTTNFMDLPRNLQLLLRADTVFASRGSLCFYPAILPDVVYRTAGEPNCGFHLAKLLDLVDVERDNNASAIARALLVRLGRPDATYAEMRILGKAFSCQRCSEGVPGTWNDIIKHCVEEQNLWKQAQPKLSSLPYSSRPIFHNTHDLALSSPCVKVLAPPAASELVDSIKARKAWLVECKVCSSLGVDAQYSHHDLPEIRSNIIKHLMTAHEIQEPIERVHFNRPGSDEGAGLSDESDDDE